MENKNLGVAPEGGNVFFERNQDRLQELFDRFLPDVQKKCRMMLEADISC